MSSFFRKCHIKTKPLLSTKQIACNEFLDTPYIYIRAIVWKIGLEYIDMKSERIITQDEGLRCGMYYHTEDTQQGCERCGCKSNKDGFYCDNGVILCRNCYDNDTN